MTAVNIPLALTCMSHFSISIFFLVRSVGTCPFGLTALSHIHLFSWSLDHKKVGGLEKKKIVHSVQQKNQVA